MINITEEKHQVQLDLPNDDEIKKEVDSIKREISESESKLEELQSKCNHSETVVKAMDGDPKSIRVICKSCGKIIGYPTSQQLKEAGYK